MTPPSGAQIIEYWARPTASVRGSVTSAAASASPASSPSTNSSPMCDRSNRPARSRTARCSSRMPVYWTGISQPPNSISRAPSARWMSMSAVSWSCSLGARRRRRRRSRRGQPGAPRGPAAAEARRGRRRRARARSRSSAGRAPRRTGPSAPARTRGRGATGRRRSAPSGSSGRSCGSGCRPGRTSYSIDGSGSTIRTSRPVSSPTSRSAVSSTVSPGSGVPLGSVQVTASRPRRRMPTTRDGRSRSALTTTPPAEVASAALRRATAPRGRSGGAGPATAARSARTPAGGVRSSGGPGGSRRWSAGRAGGGRAARAGRAGARSGASGRG